MRRWKLRGGPARRLVPSALAVCAALTAASAQTPTRDRPFPVLDEGRRFGPFLVERRFVIDRVAYDDNVFLDPDLPGFEKESDFVIALGPEIRAQTRLGRRVALTVRDKLSGELFLRNSFLNHADNELEVQLDALLGPVLLTTRGNWETLRQRPNSEIDERTRQDQRFFAQRVRLFVGARTDLSVEISRRSIRYTDEDRLVLTELCDTGTLTPVTLGESLDRDEDRLLFEAGWRLSSGSRLLARYATDDDDFLFDDLCRDAEQRTAYLGIQLSPIAQLRGTLLVGRAELENVDPRADFEPFDGTVSDLRVDYLPTGNTRFSFRVARDAVFSTYDQNLYFIEDEYAATLEALGARWGFQTGFNVREIEYPEPNVFFQPIGERRADRIDDVFAGFLYRGLGGLELGLRIGRRQRDSNAPGFRDDQRYVTTTGGFSF